MPSVRPVADILLPLNTPAGPREFCLSRTNTGNAVDWNVDHLGVVLVLGNAQPDHTCCSADSSSAVDSVMSLDRRRHDSGLLSHEE